MVYPKKIYSDNDGNFVAAAKKLFILLPGISIHLKPPTKAGFMKYFSGFFGRFFVRLWSRQPW